MVRAVSGADTERNVDVRLAGDVRALLRMCRAWSIGWYDEREEWRFDYGAASIVVSINADDTLEICSVYTTADEPGNIFGIWRLLTRAADEYGVTMILNVQPYETQWKRKQSRERVARLYQRFGFVPWQGRKYRLVRAPRVRA